MGFRSRKLASWITERRLRAHAIILAICVWSLIGIDVATPGLIDRAGNIKFQDFLQFYISAKLIRQGRLSQLFDPHVAAAELHAIVGSPTGVKLPTVYGPQVGLLLYSFSRLPFLAAALVWVAASVLLYFLCCYLVWRVCPNLQGHKGLVVLLAVAFPAFFHFVIRGQISGLILVCFVAAFFAFRSGHPFLAGLALGSLIVKPQFLVAIPVVLLAAGAWKSFAGVVIAAVGQLGVAWMYFGTAVMRSYASVLWRIPRMLALVEPGVSQAQMHSLRSFWVQLVPWPPLSLGLYAASSVAILLLVVFSWKSQGPWAVRFSALVLASVLVNPHLFVYDLLVLAPPLLLMSDWSLQHRSNPSSDAVRVLLYLTYFLPLLGPLTLLTRLQLSVPVFVTLQWMLFLILQRWPKTTSEVTA
jgi:arabinofuranan 3-O-arabinosyltransferase